MCSYRKGCSLTAVIFVSREHGGPEGMDPDGVTEVRTDVEFGTLKGGLVHPIYSFIF